MLASDVISYGPLVNTSSHVYNLDVWDQNQQCDNFPQLPSNYIPINAELLNGIPVVCGADNPQDGSKSKCFCHKLVKGVWVSIPTPPTPLCIVGSATSTLTLKSEEKLYIFLDF